MAFKQKNIAVRPGACIGVFLCLWGFCVSSAGSASVRNLNLLVYNTHGLPSLLVRDNPKERFPKIATLTQTYDLSLLQEDFAHHPLLLNGLSARTFVARGERPETPPCIICNSSGLTLISNLLDEQWRITETFNAFEACSGWVTKLNDCFAQKGFQLAVLESLEEARVVVVNTHLDAGDSEADRNARASQLNQIAATLEQVAPGEAVIVAGDFNLNWDSPQDKQLLFAFRDRLQLTRASTSVHGPRAWVALDYVYFRSGSEASLKVLDAGEDLDFEDQGEPLSDHPALFVTFSIEPIVSTELHSQP